MSGLRKIAPRSSALLALLVLLAACYYFAIRPGQLHWGATPEERARPLPGDDLVHAPTFYATRAVTIAGRPEEIWPWVVQIGYERAGFYGCDLIENLGSSRGIRSAARIIPELQRLAVGDKVYMSPVESLAVQAFEIAIWLAAFLEFVAAAVGIFVRRRWWRAWTATLLAACSLMFALYARQPLWTGALLQAPVLTALSWAWRGGAGKTA